MEKPIIIGKVYLTILNKNSHKLKIGHGPLNHYLAQSLELAFSIARVEKIEVNFYFMLLPITRLVFFLFLDKNSVYLHLTQL
ncbi:MAG: hypothetical protein ACFFD1_12375 [Candidatus Thorarchaeota archaeon]